MTARIDELYEEYVQAWHAGGAPDAVAFLARADPAERDELADMLETFALTAPAVAPSDARRAELDDDPAFARAAALVDALGPPSPEAWGVRLRAARERAEVSITELGARFAASFGLHGREERAARLLDDLERGERPASGVSLRATTRLAELLGTAAAALAPPAPAASAPAALFRADPGSADELADVLADFAASRAPAAAAPPERSGERDELDELLLGG